MTEYVDSAMRSFTHMPHNVVTGHRLNYTTEIFDFSRLKLYFEVIDLHFQLKRAAPDFNLNWESNLGKCLSELHYLNLFYRLCTYRKFAEL